MSFDSTVNQPVADFKIDINLKGKQILKQHQIPDQFPAILNHQNADYRFYYFSGNFCDNAVPITTSYFKGVSFFKSLIYESNNHSDKQKFFWNFYLPLMSEVTHNYYESLHEIKGNYISYK
jgi:hypothetical protein